MTRWIAAAGAFVVSLDSTVNVAFPAMAATYHIPPEQIRWVIVCYVLTYALMALVAGALADHIGYGRVFQAGALLGAVGYGLAGAAPTFGWLLVGRVVQGFAGGLVYGTAPGLVTLAVRPEARVRALGFLNAAIGLALTVGPMVAGVLIESFGWRAVFHVRVPLTLAVLVWAVLGLKPAPPAAVQQLVSVSQVARAPVIHASALSFIANAGIFAIWLLAPFYLVETRGLNVRVSGVLFMLTPLGTALAAPLAGWLTDRVGARLPVTIGLALEGTGLFLMSRADATTPPGVVALALFGAGLGLGIFQVPNMAVVMAAFPRDRQGAAGGLTFLARTLGIVAGVTVLAQVFAWRRSAAGFEAAFAESFVYAAVAVAVGVALGVAARRGSARGE